ncbi:sirohydrochlorin chelatase [Rhodococcus ruber]|uniref:sirohydrochlorin chelatase n=1 Tax=Rhodococcus TaxID=1827 RepID=UPI00193493D6|nr:sirohydrochlorin chelatase [Rhodococcus ruber]QRE81706.1 sirohydrochlorin chelatase [Rhodococcus ruber]
MIPLVAVAHGSRDPRSARAMAAALAVLRDRHPDRDVRLAFLDLNTPSVGQVVDAVAAEGHRRVVVVPLLLGSAFHARVDLPALLAEARVRHPRLDVVQADVLGADERLVAAAREAIGAAGLSPTDPTVGVALCAVGSRRRDANAATSTITPRLLRGTAWGWGRTCFTTAAAPTVVDALSDLRAAGATTLVLAPWMLAPGLLWDRAVAAAQAEFPEVVCSGTLADSPAVGFVIDERYRQSLVHAGAASRHTA